MASTIYTVPEEPKVLLSEATSYLVGIGYEIGSGGIEEDGEERRRTFSRRPAFSTILALACAVMGGFPFLFYGLYLVFARHHATLIVEPEGSGSRVTVGANHHDARRPVEAWLSERAV